MTSQAYAPAIAFARRCRTIVMGKLGALVGKSRVSKSCQIPGLKEKYQALGLPKRDGVFVEVGGFDGEEFSNTSFLADQGWKGLYVEPVPAYCNKIRLRHVLNRVKVEQAAVASERGTLRLNLMGPLSTFHDESVDALRDISWGKSEADNMKALEVSADTLSSILGRHGIPSHFDLMVIDVEGAEELVLTNFLSSAWRARVLIIELTDTHPDFASMPDIQASHARCRQAILSAGYSEFYSDEINSIFHFPAFPETRSR